MHYVAGDAQGNMMDGKSIDDAVEAVRPASIRRALAIADACHREPDQFAPIPSRLMVQDEGATYSLSDTADTRHRLAIVQAFAPDGRAYAWAVMMRVGAMLQLLLGEASSEAQQHGLVSAQGAATDISEAAIIVAAEAPCTTGWGFDSRAFFDLAQAATNEAIA